MKHTRAPWHYSGDSLTHKSFQIYSPYGGVGGRQTHIATTNDLPHSLLIERDAQEAEANARLIAAAPEMLGALKLLKFALSEEVSNNDGKVDFAACYQILNDAIAKAEI